MSFMIKRGMVFAAVSVLFALGSVGIWPGDGDAGLSTAHWYALAGFFFAALFAVVSAVSLVIGVVGSAWEVDNFDPNRYLDERK